MATIVCVVNCDDYTGVYFDDVLEWFGESHQNIYNILALCEHKNIELLPMIECSLEWFDDIGGVLPEKLDEVKVLHMGKDIPVAEYWEFL